MLQTNILAHANSQLVSGPASDTSSSPSSSNLLAMQSRGAALASLASPELSTAPPSPAALPPASRAAPATPGAGSPKTRAPALISFASSMAAFTSPRLESKLGGSEWSTGLGSGLGSGAGSALFALARARRVSAAMEAAMLSGFHAPLRAGYLQKLSHGGFAAWKSRRALQASPWLNTVALGCTRTVMHALLGAQQSAAAALCRVRVKDPPRGWPQLFCVAWAGRSYFVLDTRGVLCYFPERLATAKSMGVRGNAEGQPVAKASSTARGFCAYTIVPPFPYAYIVSIGASLSIDHSSL